MHPGGVAEFRTPKAPVSSLRRKSTSHSVEGTPKELISPSTCRSVSSTTEITPSFVNDDEAERRKRRKSKVLEYNRGALNSPATTPAERSGSDSLNLNQVTEHYANCLKLSTENKINAKNAFGLHLIDYMSEVFKKKETNFQVASSTIDASAKIYAGRVDAIHSETYKVLTGLGRSADKDNKDGEAEGADDLATEDGDGPPGAKRRKQTKRGKTIETNLRNINRPHTEHGVKMDPLFHLTSSAFDEGGTAGLLLNHIRTRDDMSELVLDSNTVITEHDDRIGGDGEDAAKPGALRELKEMFLSLNLEHAQICPEFQDFEFTNWSADREFGGPSTVAPGQPPLGQSKLAFDLEAEAESIPETTESETEPDDGFGPIDDMDDDDNGGNLSGQDFTLGDNKAAQMIEKTVKKIKHGTVGNLMQVLATEPSDYSYFNTNLLQTWAGPSHWKLKPKSKGETIPGPESDVKKPRKKKGPLVIKQEEEVDVEKKFKETKASTTLTKATLEKHTSVDKSLPEYYNYEEDELFKVCTKPKVMIKRQKRKSDEALDDQINYDYDNTNDKDNFCPAEDMGDNDDDDDGDHSAGFDLTAGTTQYVQSQDLSQGAEGEEGGPAADGFSGDNLVAQPHKVAKIDIGYAKTAKKMDVKRLKTSIWGLLMEEDPSFSKEPEKGAGDAASSSKEAEQSEEKEADDTTTTGDGDKSKRRESVAGPHSFRHIVEELPSKVSKNMAKNLSVPIAFICLLHLANEKTLALKSSDDMTDISINQG